jgi:hypothetical protein
MGFLFGKKKASPAQAAPVEAAPVKTGRQSTTGPRVQSTLRQSRRVVAAPVAKPSAPKSVLPSPQVASATGSADGSLPDELELSAAVPVTSEARPLPMLGGPSASLSSGHARSGEAALAEFLVGEAKLVTAEQMQVAQAKARADGLPIDTVLSASGVISEEAILGALSQARYYPHLQLDRYAIRKKALDTVSREDALRLSVMPVDKLGSLLQLAMVNPLDEETVSFIHSRTGLEVKRCIATRAELQRGIDKWYGGQVQAQDASISFVAEPTQEVKSLTQVLGNVAVVTRPPEPDSASGSSTASARFDIAPEIQDIDDLLSADESIAPAIVEPIHLDEAPLVVPADEVVEVGRAVNPVSAALEPRHASVTAESNSGLHEAAFDEVPITKPVVRSRPADAGFVQLVPVLEDEFKYAITHNKAHVFEKWVGLQTRNRIINAVPVEAALEPLLTALA